jgi:hypothetical protein
MESRKWGPTLKDTLMPKSLLTKTFLHVKEIGKQVASLSTSLMSLIKEPPTWKLGKIHIP